MKLINWFKVNFASKKALIKENESLKLVEKNYYTLLENHTITKQEAKDLKVVIVQAAKNVATEKSALRGKINLLTIKVALLETKS